MKRVLVIATLLSAGCSSPVSCVARGTAVRTPCGRRPIEDLEVGDEVFAVDEDTGELIATRITGIQSARREVGLLRCGEHELRLTSDHPVYCPDEAVYAPAGDWLRGLRTALLTVDGVVPVDCVETFVGVSEVFDITVEHERHNFIAGGIVVHNKTSATCEFQGEVVTEGAACTCTDGSTGRVDCDVESSCRCGDANNVFDLGVDDDTGAVDMSMNNTTPDASADVGAEDVSSDSGGDAATMSRERGDCVTDDDCARDTWSCISIPADEPGGHFTCQADAAAEPGCATIEAPDTCCVHADCTDDPSGTCVTGPIFYCGGVQPVIANVCLYDECAVDSDCASGQICLPPRVFGEPVSRCVAAECGTDGDCTTGSGGECHMFRDPCNGRVSGFFCTYDDSDCRTGADCPDDPNTPGTEYCSPGPDGDGDTLCASFSPPP